jgi:hypothetical protein
MADKLSVYRGVCRACGERKLASLTETVKIRRLIDDVWADDAGVKACLQAAYWNFAMQDSAITYSPSVEPEFGFQRAFDKPEDWVRTFQVSNEETFTNLKYRYKDQHPYWYADDDTIYASYVSSDTTRGMDLSLWTPFFTLYVEHHLASLIVVDLENSRSSKQDIEQSGMRYFNKARATDAMDESMKFKPTGSWATARRGGRSGRENG